MELKKYKQIADLFESRNAGEPVKDDLKTDPETEKLKIIWEDLQPADVDTSSIVMKTMQKIQRDKIKRRKRLVIVSCSVAASLVIFISGLFLVSQKNHTVSGLHAVVAQLNEQTVEEVTLVTQEKKLNLDEGAVISYTGEGKIVVNSSEVEDVNDMAGTGKKEPEYNQLLVPAGKRAYIELSDGTQLAVNALSKVVYPRVFDKDKREIYVQGEVFLDVTHDEKRPFVVTTDEFDLSVLGTKFNICNYKSLGASNVILVDGSVEVTDKNRNKATLSPNDLLSITNGAISGREQVDVSGYISWVDGLLLLKWENLSYIVEKLKIYYGREVQYSPAVADKKIYGKLDLKDQLSEVVESIRQILAAEVPENERIIWLE